MMHVPRIIMVILEAVGALREKKKRKTSKSSRVSYRFKYSCSEEENEGSDYHSDINECSIMLDVDGKNRLTNRREAVCERCLAERMFVKEWLRQNLINGH